MPLVSFEPIPGSRKASGNKDNQSFTRIYTLQTSDAAEPPELVATYLPWSVGDFINGWAITNIAIDESSLDGCQWEVTVDYGTSEASDPNPLNEPWTYAVSYESHQVPIDYDIHQRPILNTAGDLFAEYMMRDDSRPVLTASRNFPSFPFNVANQYANTINRDSVFGADPRTLKFERITGQQQRTKINGNDLTYFSVTIEITYQREGWQRKVLNQGLREKKDGKLVPIKIKGKDITAPVLLKQDGTKSEPSEPPYVLKFDLYREQNFQPLFA